MWDGSAKMRYPCSKAGGNCMQQKHAYSPTICYFMGLQMLLLHTIIPCLGAYFPCTLLALLFHILQHFMCKYYTCIINDITVNACDIGNLQLSTQVRVFLYLL